MPLISYQDVRPWAKAIRAAVVNRKMPPWFADVCCGTFANDRSLTTVEIGMILSWADNGAPMGDQADGKPAANPPNVALRSPDVILPMPQAFAVPAKGEVAYQRYVIPTGSKADRWIQAAEVRPTARGVVHHAVVYVREPGETWTQGPTKADILSVYTPGSEPDVWPEGMAKFVPAGSALILELHYTPNGKPATDQTRISLQFAKSAPHKRVLTLQLNNTKLLIPPGDANYHVTTSGTMPNDALLLGFLPHMHLRGKAFEYDRIAPGGAPEPLLRINKFDFHNQLSYKLSNPLLLKKGTRLSATAWYDNSSNNPRNPDPTKEVHWGEQSWDEMMVGFFDVAVEPSVDKKAFFVRQ
ncbi:MAG: thiol-disulfide isomerase [Bryobacteraceae bacterium]